MSFRSSAKLAQLEARLGSDWKTIRAARDATQQRRAALTAAFASQGSPDTSLVVFGSVAREEVTSGSDLDWILLIDGQSVPEHKQQEREIKRTLVAHGFINPGAGGVFGKMVANNPPDIVPIPLADVVGRTKTVPLDSDLIKTARAIGVALGD